MMAMQEDIIRLEGIGKEDIAQAEQSQTLFKRPMSLHFKAIIPLLGEGIMLDDIDHKKGFIGAYSYDLNRPALETHFFLLYIFITTNFSIDRDKRLKSLPTFRSKKIVHIKGFSIACYAFNNNESINSIISDRWFVRDEERLRIFKFWNFTDKSINQYMLHPETHIFSETFEHVAIPLWDSPPEYQTKYP